MPVHRSGIEAEGSYFGFLDIDSVVYAQHDFGSFYSCTIAVLFPGSLPEWGVTVLQADEEMDAGDVWSSNNFSVPHTSSLTKSAFYNKVSTYTTGRQTGSLGDISTNCLHGVLRPQSAHVLKIFPPFEQTLC